MNYQPNQAGDAEFLASLRGMVDAAAPQFTMPTAASVVPMARRRLARRRSIISGAFGVALLAGAGVTQLAVGAGSGVGGGVGVPIALEPTVVAPAPAPEAGSLPEPAAEPIGIAPLDGNGVGIAPADDAVVGIAPAGVERLGTEVIVDVAPSIAPLGDGIGSEEIYYDTLDDEAGSSSPTNFLVPGLFAVGSGALVGSGVIAVRARRQFATSRAVQ